MMITREMFLTWRLNHAPTMWSRLQQWWRKMKPQLEIMRAITSNIRAEYNLPNGATVLGTFGMTVGEVVSINRETFPHKSEPGGIKMCRKMPSWHSVGGADKLTGETKWI